MLLLLCAAIATGCDGDSTIIEPSVEYPATPDMSVLAGEWDYRGSFTQAYTCPPGEECHTYVETDSGAVKVDGRATVVWGDLALQVPEFRLEDTTAVGIILRYYRAEALFSPVDARVCNYSGQLLVACGVTTPPRPPEDSRIDFEVRLYPDSASAQVRASVLYEGDSNTYHGSMVSLSENPSPLASAPEVLERTDLVGWWMRKR